MGSIALRWSGLALVASALILGAALVLVLVVLPACAKLLPRSACAALPSTKTKGTD